MGEDPKGPGPHEPDDQETFESTPVEIDGSEILKLLGSTRKGYQSMSLPWPGTGDRKLKLNNKDSTCFKIRVDIRITLYLDGIAFYQDCNARSADVQC